MTNEQLFDAVTSARSIDDALAVFLSACIADAQRSANARQRRLFYETRNSIVLDGVRFTILEVERVENEKLAEQFKARLTLRSISTRRLASVYLKRDDSFGFINYK